MKARVKATGEVVYIRPYGNNSSSVLWKDIYRNITYTDCELDFEVTDKDEIYNKGWADGWDEAVKSEIHKIHSKLKDSDLDYWTRLEHQYAGMAMQAIISKQTVGHKLNTITDLCCDIAHSLVQKLKKNEEWNNG